MTPKELGEKMVSGLSEDTLPFALVGIRKDGRRVEVIVPQVWQRMIQDPREREHIVAAIREQLEIMGKHPEDWNGQVRLA